MTFLTEEEREYAKIAGKIQVAFNYHNENRLTKEQLQQIYKIIYGTEYSNSPNE